MKFVGTAGSLSLNKIKKCQNFTFINYFLSIYCHDPPFCTSDDMEWEPCIVDDKKKNKTSGDGDDDEGRQIVKKIKACIYYKDESMEDKCVDLILSASLDDSIVDIVCGFCTVAIWWSDKFWAEEGFN